MFGALVKFFLGHDFIFQEELVLFVDASLVHFRAVRANGKFNFIF